MGERTYNAARSSSCRQHNADAGECVGVVAEETGATLQ
jgi:hypothetical protein